MTNYSIIYADPPWHTKPYGKQSDNSRAPSYPTMADSDLAAEPVGSLAASDSVLFMWVVDHKLKDGIALGEAWGFTHNTVGFYWLKRTPLDNGWNKGTGYTTRAGSVEQCLLFKRGKGLKRVHKGVWRLFDDVIFPPEHIIHPVMAHSRKPDEIRRRIEKLYGDVPRIELFARKPATGWDVWGNEVDSSEAASAVLGHPLPPPPKKHPRAVVQVQDPRQMAMLTIGGQPKNIIT